jgi:myo-inositol-1(or 4)-monophosphatase
MSAESSSPAAVDGRAALELAVKAANEAGSVLVSARPSSLDTKGHDHDWVTDVDGEVEVLIRRALSSSPWPVLGEEAGGASFAELRSGTVWVVDPVDGTENFVFGSPLFGVNVALVSRGVVVAGCTHLPLLGESFTAFLGGGAWLGSSRLRLGSSPHLDKAPVVISAHDPVRPLLYPLPVRRLGASSVEAAFTAAGRFSAVTYQAAHPWDIAPGVVLILEAGGVVSPRGGFSSVWEEDAVSGATVNPGSFLAGRGAVVSKVLAAEASSLG